MGNNKLNPKIRRSKTKRSKFTRQRLRNKTQKTDERRLYFFKRINKIDKAFIDQPRKREKS